MKHYCNVLYISTVQDMVVPQNQGTPNTTPNELESLLKGGPKPYISPISPFVSLSLLASFPLKLPGLPC